MLTSRLGVLNVTDCGLSRCSTAKLALRRVPYKQMHMTSQTLNLLLMYNLFLFNLIVDFKVLANVKKDIQYLWTLFINYCYYYSLFFQLSFPVASCTTWHSWNILWTFCWPTYSTYSPIRTNGCQSQGSTTQGLLIYRRCEIVFGIICSLIDNSLIE